jgi:hypothetical protein
MEYSEQRRLLDRFIRKYLGLSLDDLPDNYEINDLIEEVESAEDAERIARAMYSDVIHG